MKAIGVIMILVGIAACFFGAYYGYQLKDVSYMGVSATSLLSIGRELGFTSSLSFYDRLTYWCAENATAVIIGGVVLNVLGVLICAQKPASVAAYTSSSCCTVDWRCSECGELNRYSRCSCAKCGKIKPNKTA